MNSELAALQEKLEESTQKKEKIDQFLINSRGIFRQQVRGRRRRSSRHSDSEKKAKIKSEGKKEPIAHIMLGISLFFFTCSIFCLQSIF